MQHFNLEESHQKVCLCISGPHVSLKLGMNKFWSKTMLGFKLLSSEWLYFPVHFFPSLSIDYHNVKVKELSSLEKVFPAFNFLPKTSKVNMFFELFIFIISDIITIYVSLKRVMYDRLIHFFSKTTRYISNVNLLFDDRRCSIKYLLSSCVTSCKQFSSPFSQCNSSSPNTSRSG